MDFIAFYVWRKNFAIGEMVKAPIRPETCHRVYKELFDEGYAKIDTDGYYTLTPKATDAYIASAERAAKRGMGALVKENERLIRKLVAQLSRHTSMRVEDQDMFQAGLMAFMRALERFDPDRFSIKKQGASFSTYLRHWVRHYMQIAILDEQTIKRPRGYGMPASVHKKMREIFELTGQRATPEQLGTFKDGKKERPVTQELLDTWAICRNTITSIESMQSGRSAILADECEEYIPFGVAQKIAQGEGDLPDSSKSPEELLGRAQMAQKAEEIVATLCESDRLLVEEIREGVSNKKIAKRMGVTEEYARQKRWALMEKLQRMVGRSM